MADKELRSIMEAFYNAAHMVIQSNKSQRTKSQIYSKTKRQGDASVTVSANADSMEELHSILKLAGIDFDPKAAKSTIMKKASAMTHVMTIVPDCDQ